MLRVHLSKAVDLQLETLEQEESAADFAVAYYGCTSQRLLQLLAHYKLAKYVRTAARVPGMGRTPKTKCLDLKNSCTI